MDTAGLPAASGRDVTPCKAPRPRRPGRPTPSFQAMVWPLLICLLALAVRLHRLAEPLLRWDEGWSVGHASRSWAEVVQIAAWEVHPPLFYLLLKPWLMLGRNVYVLRLFPVLLSLLVVPLAYQVAKLWLKRLSLARLAAGLMAFAPGLVYYAQVVRMYPLIVLWLLLCCWALLRWLDGGGMWAWAGLLLAGLAALYTLYYTAFALLGLYGYGLLVGRNRRKGLLAAGAATVLLYLPWLLYAGTGVLQRMGQAVPAETVMPVTLWGVLSSVWTALTFDLGSGGWAALTVLAVLVIALAVGRPVRRATSRLLMPALPLVTATTGITLGSGFYYFAPRLLTPAMPFLLLLLAWALDSLARRSRLILVAGLAILCVAFWPTSSRFVYEKSLEVSGPFDPHEYHTMFSSRAHADDLVFFNELALAGWYEVDRSPGDPAWSYALRWTPIVEPMAQIRPRVEQAAGKHSRLWFVMYQGSFGPGAELKSWLDETFYPASLDWGSDSLFLSYLSPPADWHVVTPHADFGGLVRLEAAQFSARPGQHGEVAVALRWQALQAPLPDCRVVLQVWDEAGNVLAQRDVRPGNWERPTSRWAAGEVIEEHHGLLLTQRSQTPLHLAIFVYDAGTGSFLSVNGATFLELGELSGGPL